VVPMVLQAEIVGHDDDFVASQRWFGSIRPLDEAIRRLAERGYDGVEISCAAPHTLPTYLTREEEQSQ
jgi:sugar phosphate isomerase/epimerase